MDRARWISVSTVSSVRSTRTRWSSLENGEAASTDAWSSQCGDRRSIRTVSSAEYRSTIHDPLPCTHPCPSSACRTS